MPEIVITGDGSQTLYVKELDEHYHSTYGAITESRHVFIEAGFLFLNRDPVKVLEIGFGTGLNTYLTLIEADRSEITVDYCGIEKYPHHPEVIADLNYPDHFNDKYSNSFRLIHEGPWNKSFFLSESFTLKKVKEDIAIWPIDDTFDIVYFDAFAPGKQPELWTPEIFSKIFEALSPGGVITTYASKGDVRRALSSVGFQTEKLQGPPGKREMLRARKVI